jgi:carbamoyl-phosphate synthase large subunit
MEHIEEAGVHSGDSACVIPSISLDKEQLKQIREATEKIAKDVGVRGLINIQFAISGSPKKLYVLEANPRASRTVPFVAKATGIALAKAAALISTGVTIADLRKENVLPASGDGHANGVSVKEAVLPFNRFRRIDGTGVDSVLGPEMKSTGEVMGIANNFGLAFAKSQTAAFGPLPNQAGEQLERCMN